YHKMPILVEEYISGQEVELILVGNTDQILFSKEVQLIMDNKEFFDNEIWGYETKKIDDSNIDFKMSHFISYEYINKIHILLMSLNYIVFILVDLIFYYGVFFLIEISADFYLGYDCVFYYVFQQNGYSLSEMFEFLIQNGLIHYQY